MEYPAQPSTATFTGWQGAQPGFYAGYSTPAYQSSAYPGYYHGHGVFDYQNYANGQQAAQQASEAPPAPEEAPPGAEEPAQAQQPISTAPAEVQAPYNTQHPWVQHTPQQQHAWNAYYAQQWGQHVNAQPGAIAYPQGTYSTEQPSAYSSPAPAAAAAHPQIPPTWSKPAATPSPAAAIRPAPITAKPAAPQSAINFTIKPQMAKPKKPAATNGAHYPNAAAAAASGVASKPAYTQVAAASAAPSKAWPPPLRAYVERAFGVKTTDAERLLLNVKLKEIITKAEETGECWTRNWDVFPLPSLTEPVSTVIPGPPKLPEKATPPRPAARWGPVPAAASTSFKSQACSDSGSEYSQAPGRPGHRRSRRSRSRSRSLSLDPSSRPLTKKQKKRAAAEVAKSAAKVKANFTIKGKKANKPNVWKRATSEDADDVVLDEGELRRRQQRDRRFQSSARAAAAAAAATIPNFDVMRLKELKSDAGGAEQRFDDKVIKGTCQKLEKSYFRLTAAPDPSVVRPLPVLKSALSKLVASLRDGSATYFYALDQFKGMRQDLTVQHIHDEVAAQVYEAHARAALEYGDMAEYNQCQQQLETLHKSGVKGCEQEFLACRLLYQSAHSKHGEATALLATLQAAVDQAQPSREVLHAISVCEAMQAHNYRACFKLYASAPRMGRALMDIAYPNLRFDALRMLCEGFRPTLSVSHAARLLGFVASTSQPDLQEQHQEIPPGSSQPQFSGKHAAAADAQMGEAACLAWLTSCQAVITSSPGAPSNSQALDCKACVGKLVMPQVEAVTHGDVNLALDDFMTHAE
ncbi:hypothetical protein WJX74_009622 [Apatococcus lobatus]|uniref:SAC3/GANP/THP3 conserved domain-containing protein n=1 Tax=Apatococcus lobatus TaxID=904363 RepID=A0AAW1RPX9_9CHLO